VIAALTTVTVIQRVLHVRKELRSLEQNDRESDTAASPGV
jgi:hypothetical protein